MKEAAGCHHGVRVLKTRGYGWRPDLPDARDHVLLVKRATKLPKSVDLRGDMSAVEDQGDLGSCTANAIAGALEYLELRQDHATFVDVSRLFIYYNERAIEGTVGEDSGAYIRDGVKACNKIGYCSEKTWPYTISKFTNKPSAKAFTEAAQRKITQYARVLTLSSLKQSLANGVPVVFGFSVYEAFESEKVANSGVLNMPTSSEQLLGGHAVLAVGYDDASKRVIVRNSWGPDWGQRGYFTMPYAYVESRDLSDDFWAITR